MLFCCAVQDFMFVFQIVQYSIKVMVMETPSAQCVGREFVRQYYTLLHEAPLHLHRWEQESLPGIVFTIIFETSGTFGLTKVVYNLYKYCPNTRLLLRLKSAVFKSSILYFSFHKPSLILNIGTFNAEKVATQMDGWWCLCITLTGSEICQTKKFVLQLLVPTSTGKWPVSSI